MLNVVRAEGNVRYDDALDERRDDVARGKERLVIPRSDRGRDEPQRLRDELWVG